MHVLELTSSRSDSNWLDSASRGGSSSAATATGSAAAESGTAALTALLTQVATIVTNITAAIARSRGYANTLTALPPLPPLHRLSVVTAGAGNAARTGDVTTPFSVPGPVATLGLHSWRALLRPDSSILGMLLPRLKGNCSRTAGRLSKQWATATPPVTFTDVGSASGGSASGGNASGDAAGATGDNADGDVEMEGRATPSVAAADGAG